MMQGEDKCGVGCERGSVGLNNVMQGEDKSHEW